MNKIIVNNKDIAAQNIEIRKAVLKAMADSGWKLRDDGTIVDIDVAVLEARSAVSAEAPFWFIQGGVVWRWEAFNSTRPELERDDSKRMHCVDLAVELLGEEAVAVLISDSLSLNSFGFSADDYMPSGKFSLSAFVNQIIAHTGPWRVFKSAGEGGGGVYTLYRYNQELGIYQAASQTDVTRLSREVEPALPSKVARAIYDEVLTSSGVNVEKEIYTKRVPVRGGKLLDLRTMQTEEYDDSLFITGRLNARWDETPDDVARTRATPGGKMALRLLHGIEDPQDRKVFLQYLAYTLTPEFHLKRFLIIYGNSHCGKSTLMNAWTRGVCAEGMCTTFDPGRAFGGGEGSRFGLQGLIGKRIACCDEWGSYRLPDLGVLKSIVAGEQVDVDVKNKETRSLVLPVKFLAGSNTIPSFQDASGAIYNRLIILDFSRDPFDPATSPNFASWYHDEDFCTVLLREAVEALNDPASRCWDKEAEEWYVKRLATPSAKSQELRRKVRDESAKCVEVFAEMLAGGDEEIPVNQMLGVQWSAVQLDFKDLYARINGKAATEITVDYINSTLIGTTIGGKQYQLCKDGGFYIGPQKFSRRGLIYEYSRDYKTNILNIRKSGVWNLYAQKCEEDENTFTRWLIDSGLSEYVNECLCWVHEIAEETERLKREQNKEVEVG